MVARRAEVSCPPGQPLLFLGHGTVSPMSALPPKADMCTAIAHVRYGPIADIVAASKLFASAWSTRRTREKQQFTGDCSDLRSPLCDTMATASLCVARRFA